MSVVFLDVGAHLGETLSVAMQPQWGFDRIYSFEPAPECWATLEALADDRVEILKFGLWSSDETLVLHDPGTIGASLSDGKRTSDRTVEVDVRDVATWFAEHLDPDDEVVVKINCEGAECDVLDRLLDSGEIAKIDEMAVHFDVRKVPGKEHRETTTRARLDALGVSYRPAEAIFFGRNTGEKTANWLAWYRATGVNRWKYSVIRRGEFAVRVAVFRLRHRLGLAH